MIRFQERSRPRDTSSDRSHDRGISEDGSRKRFASSDRTGDRRRFASGDSPSPMRRSSSRASSDDEYFGESPSRSSPGESPSRSSPGESPSRSPPGESPSRSSPGESPSRSSPAPVQAMVDFILQTFPEYQASPSHPSSRSFDFLLLWTWLKRFPSMSDSPVILRMGRLATPFSILSTG